MTLALDELAALDAIVYCRDPKHPLLERIREERDQARVRESAISDTPTLPAEHTPNGLE